jgi:hypothetical protein
MCVVCAYGLSSPFVGLGQGIGGDHSPVFAGSEGALSLASRDGFTVGSLLSLTSAEAAVQMTRVGLIWARRPSLHTLRSQAKDAWTAATGAA